MKLQKILSNFQKLHPKEIDLSLDRIKNLCEKLGNPQDKIKAISVVGTNGKNSTIQAAAWIVEFLPFVPTTDIALILSCGLPNFSQRFFIRSSDRSISLGCNF